MQSQFELGIFVVAISIPIVIVLIFFLLPNLKYIVNPLCDLIDFGSMQASLHMFNR